MVMLVLVASITAVPADAAANGIYVAEAQPHYRNPETGIIEDAGGESSDVLGQSMTESATGRRALVEVDPEGNTFVTIRLGLMDNITDVQFWADGAAVSATRMQEDYGNNTADFRMQVPDEHALLRCRLSVSAMGRDVIFFITLSGLRAGSEDFISSVEVYSPPEAAAPEPPDVTEPPQETPSEAQPAPEPSGPAAAEIPEESQPQTGADVASETKKHGVQVFNRQGEDVTKASTSTERGNKLGGFFIVLSGAAVVAAAGFGVWYFGRFKKKK